MLKDTVREALKTTSLMIDTLARPVLTPSAIERTVLIKAKAKIDNAITELDKYEESTLVSITADGKKALDDHAESLVSGVEGDAKYQKTVTEEDRDKIYQRFRDAVNGSPESDPNK